MKKILLIILGLLTLVSIPVTVYYIGRNQEIRKQAAPATTALLSPAALTTAVGETFSLSVEINTGSNQVVSANLALEFDPTKFEAQSITNGPFFPKILTAGSVSPGSASITVSAPSTTQPVSGTGVAAVIRLKTLAEAPAPVSVRFSTSTFIGGIGEDQANVLVGTSPTTITIHPATTQTSQISSLSPTQTAQPLIQASQTPPPVPTELIPSTPTVQASSSGTVLLMNPIEGGTISNATTFQGKAAPGSTVTIVIHSDPVTATVVADENGYWTYTPTTTLASGSHTVIASAQNPGTGTVETTSAQFEVSDSDTLTPMPESGTTDYTVFLLLVSGVLFYFGIRMSHIKHVERNIP